MEVAMALMKTVVEDEEEQYERLVEVFKYKRVANKVRLVETTLPEEYRIPLLRCRSCFIRHRSSLGGSGIPRSDTRQTMLTPRDSFGTEKRR